MTADAPATAPEKTEKPVKPVRVAFGYAAERPARAAGSCCTWRSRVVAAALVLLLAACLRRLPLRRGETLRRCGRGLAR
ncbi:hypothetical protein SCALM49S_06159 [Streptomyces californicus]